LSARIADLRAVPGRTSGGVLLAVAAGPESEAGTYRATPLGVSGDWQVGVGSGEFQWNADFALPEAPAGPTPTVSLGYSSGAVDGMVTSRNTQAGQAGLGWNDFANAFVERRYNSCRNDGQGTSDLCWKSDNATLSLNGRSAELVRAPGATDPPQWRLRADPRWRVEQLRGAANGDNDGEHWRVTTPDGTRYLFGLGVHPGPNWATKSTWTVPVFGDDAGEACHTAATGDLDWCDQAWRWNLDRVEDPNANTQTYAYAREMNHYAALNGWPGFTSTPYVRAGHLEAIYYGKRAEHPDFLSAKVEFSTRWRCGTLDVGKACEAPGTAGFTFPDVPTDLLCEQDCTVTTPTFFSAVRYTEVSTAVRDPYEWLPQDRYFLSHTYQDPDPATAEDAKLFLTGIQRMGRAGTALTLPPTTFAPVTLNNRVDTAGALSAMPHWRIGVVTDEFGRQVQPTYGQPHPCPNPIPDPPNWDLNTRDCFPQRWAPDGGVPGFAIFHRYLVTQVEVRDTTGGSPPMTTRYAYGDQVLAGLPNAAWHHDRDEFVPLANQTWSEWRGYADVQLTQGGTRNRYRLFRGMRGDRLAGDPFPGPGSRAATVSSLDGTVVDTPDSNWLAGMTLDEVSLRADGAVERGTLHGYRAITSVDAPGPDPVDDARWVGENDTVERRRTPSGGYVRRRLQTLYNALLAFPEQVIEHGWLDRTGDERCTRTTYVIDAGTWMLDFPTSETRYADAACAGAEVARTETAYDGGAVGAPPTRGNPTTSRVKIDADTWATTTTTYDTMGRPLVVTDPNGHTTTTAHASPKGYPAWTTVTNHLGHRSRTDFVDPDADCPGCVTLGRQLPAAQTDANGKRTTRAYDSIGRLTAIRRPTEQTGPASWVFAYLIDPNRAAAPVVRTRQLQDNGGAGGAARYLDTWVVHDSLLRERQTHTMSPAAGRVIVADTSYDGRGLVQVTNLPEAVTGTPGAGVLPAPAGGWANRRQVAYDELSRPVWELFFAGTTAERSTVTAYTHESAEATPVTGGRIRTVTDAYDRTVRLEEHDGTAYRSTAYGHDVADRLTSITDPAGNLTAFGYDMAGRRIAMADPDGGAWSYGYDPVGNQTSTTDPAGVRTHTVYDALDRTTERRRDSATGTLLARWGYDASGERGLLDRATRATPTGNWIIDVTGYDGRDRPTGRTWTVPSGVPGLSGSYPVSYGYDAADHVRTVSYPGVGGLPAETVTTAYDPTGLSETMAGLGQYVHVAAYDDRARPLLFGFGPGAAPTMGKLWQYNANQQLARMVAAVGETGVQDLRISYDRAQNVTERHTTLAGQTWRECFGYDQRHRLTSAFTTVDGCAAGARGTGPQPYHHTYAYSVDGNLTSRVEGATTIAYTYPAAGPAAVRPHAPTQVGATALTWNAAGGVASRAVGGQTETFTWDAEHRLARVQGAGGDSRFVYDPDGGRLLRQGADRSTLYFEGHEVSASPGGSPVAVRSYTFDGAVIATRAPSGVHYLVTDDQNSVQASVAAGTTDATVRTYQPYGRSRHAGRHATDRGWIGQVEDQETGLSYLNARYYDPALGVFLSPDPVIDEDRPKTVNPYAYSLNNPTTNSDPTGLDPPCAHPGSSCSNEALAGQIQVLAPSRSYEEVLAHVEREAADDGPAAVEPTAEQAEDLRISGGESGTTLDEVSQSISATGTVVDVADLGLELCDSNGCAPITRIVGRVGVAADLVGVAIECHDGVDGPCVWAAGLAVAKQVPIVGEIILAVELLDATGLGQHYADILNEALEGYIQNFGTVLTWDREVVAEHGGPVYETGNANPRMGAGGVPPPPNGVVQGGAGCPLRNPQGVEPLPGC
jgi:RHS repeat-associated protein